MNIFGKGTLKT